jgi:hypothetical protein
MAMALARVVEFEGVSADRMAAMREEVRAGGRPEGLPATEILALYDADAGRAIVVVFFDDEDDYRRGDEVLDAMPAGETPGRRTSVGRYEVAVRMTD